MSMSGKAVSALIMLVAMLLGAAPAGAVALSVSKSQATVWDPVDLGVLPKAVPGAQVDYTISVTNPVTQTLTARPTSITDKVPPGTKLYVGNLDSTNGGPVVFGKILTSALGYTYTALTNGSDDLEFSNEATGTDFSYQPSHVDSDGCDPTITFVRVKISGAMGVLESFSIRFRTIVK